IHSSPPWQDLDVPMMTINEYGTGRAVYSAVPIESANGESEARLFVEIVRSLLDGRLSYTAEAHPALWMSACDQPDCTRVMASFLNFQADLPPVPVPVSFELRPPRGRIFRKLTLVPDGRAIGFAIDSDGTLRARLESVALLAMVVAEYD
ncbi:MAG TPA: hypothetical protein VIX12_06715, partial [Candidatus Binataceae bacterium]